MKILGIETSCDETASSVVEIKNKQVSIVSHTISSQIKLHQKFGGVVPELAARHHLKNIIPVLESTIKKPSEIDFIAVTQGPGLMTSLFAGLETAKALSLVWQKPLIAINHMEAHIYANWIERPWKEIKFPAICLIASGGHTEIVLIKDEYNFRQIGQTVDDAGGEAFDKVAKILGVPYPGGPNIEKLALAGDSTKYNFPRPMLNKPNFNFSFSGLKTAVLYFMQDNFKNKKPTPKQKADICASFQQAVCDVLVAKTLKASQKYKAKTLMLAGGVAANKFLRQEFQRQLDNSEMKLNFIFPSLTYCTDNASMVAMAGYFKAKKKKFAKIDKLTVDPGLDIK